MTSGWDLASDPVPLEAPWQDFWVRVYVDPPLGAYLDLQAAHTRALANPTRENLDVLVGCLAPLIAEHNITARDGGPITWTVRDLAAGLIAKVADAVKLVQKGGGSADPLPKRSSSRRPSSRTPASPASRSLRTTRSGRSR